MGNFTIAQMLGSKIFKLDEVQTELKKQEDERKVKLQAKKESFEKLMELQQRLGKAPIGKVEIRYKRGEPMSYAKIEKDEFKPNVIDGKAVLTRLSAGGVELEDYTYEDLLEKYGI